METHIEKDSASIEHNNIVLEVLDMTDFPDFGCVVFSTYMRYPEFENKDDDPFYQLGDEYWQILPSYESFFEMFRMYEV